MFLEQGVYVIDFLLRNGEISQTTHIQYRIAGVHSDGIGAVTDSEGHIFVKATGGNAPPDWVVCLPIQNSSDLIGFFFLQGDSNVVLVDDVHQLNWGVGICTGFEQPQSDMKSASKARTQKYRFIGKPSLYIDIIPDGRGVSSCCELEKRKPDNSTKKPVLFCGIFFGLWIVR